MTETLIIDRLGHQGDGVARHNGQDVFVPFALPGETVEGVVENGRMIAPRVLTPSAQRIKPACRHFKTCGGCSTQHISDELLSEWKQQSVIDTLKASNLTPVFRPLHSSPARSRRRAVFSGKRTKKGAMVGFHARGSDVLIDLLDCAVVRPEILAGMDGLKRLVRIAASRKAEVRLNVTCSDAGLDIDVQEAKPLEPAQRVEVSAIAQQQKFARIAWNGDVVLQIQPPLQHFGPGAVIPPPGSFLQATPEGEAALVAAVQEITQQAKRVLDLFAGCGTFSLPLAQNAEVHAVEGQADMLSALDTAWRVAQGVKTIRIETRDLFRRPLMPDEFKGYDAAVIDPPRAGARAQVEELAKGNLAHIAFVSCNPATFARDAHILIAGGYRLDWVQVVDQFRWSAHSELVAQFTLNRS